METNTSATNTYFDLEHSNALPVLIRKIHLGKCLDEGNWEAIRKDLNDRPVEDVDGNSSEEDILEVLNYYGVFDITSVNGEPSTLVTIWSSATVGGDEDEDSGYSAAEGNQNSMDAPEAEADSNSPGMNIKEVANLIKDVIGYKGFFRYNQPEDPTSLFDRDLADELVENVSIIYKMYLGE